MQPLDSRAFPATAPYKRARPRRAPSKAMFFLERLWYTRPFRWAALAGLPALALGAALAGYLSDPGNRGAWVSRVGALVESFHNRPEFMIFSLRVVSDSPEVMRHVEEALGLEFPVSSFDLDLDAIQARVVAIDMVEASEVEISREGVITIVVSERFPRLLWSFRDRDFLLDGKGKPMSIHEIHGDVGRFPRVVGAGANEAVSEALSIFALAGERRLELWGLVRVGERRWDVVLADDAQILLPERDSLRALGDAIEVYAGGRFGEVSVLDYRNPSRPALRNKLN